MSITRLNHAVLYVRDVERSRDFYENVLGFRTLIFIPGQAAFFQASGSTNDHDLGLFQIGSGAGPSPAGRTSVGMYHLAWEVDTLTELDRLRAVLLEAGALVGASDHVLTKSLYAQDPDGLEFEVCWIIPAALVTEADRERAASDLRPRPLDLDAEIARYGAETKGGIGVSIPAFPDLPATVAE
ncbi:VOC family protein [Actinocorallia aurantiaca]|jgi:catechol-2,3-dioxygenase|uniref:VOC family protein n=1 Tax=Actinocorallia aurantiaca TaxID=46204 RepID=A0ABP6H0A7_9ACTN